MSSAANPAVARAVASDRGRSSATRNVAIYGTARTSYPAKVWGSVGPHGEDVLSREAVLLGDGIRGQARGELTEHDMDGNAGAFDHRLAKTDALVNNDPWRQLDHPYHAPHSFSGHWP